MARVYLASSWRNKYQQTVLHRIRYQWGHKVYDFRNPPHSQGFAWGEIAEDWESWSLEEARHHLLTNPIASHGFTSDIRGMRWADTCVLLNPCGKSAHSEAGVMKGEGKRVIVYNPEPIEPELMYLLYDDIVINVDELRDALAN